MYELCRVKNLTDAQLLTCMLVFLFDFKTPFLPVPVMLMLVPGFMRGSFLLDSFVSSALGFQVLYFAQLTK